ncbi:flagellar export chaperone FlgN [Neptunicella sp. SCSIO 80796]|uniref:flagellar export chaperone FlgN n=1 Tax=Neptunicella plasticusilytica TaxID=3117012 RepID=UPI003A4D40C6
MSDGLNQAFVKQQQQLETLKLTLETELSLISARNPDALIKLLEEKEQLLNDIAEQDQVIANLYQQTSPDEKDIQPAIDLIEHLLAECRYRTEINQTAVEQGQLRLAHLRNVIVESRAKESMTYDKAGHTRSGGKGKGVSA